jgi:hypothetical protein
LVKGIEKDEQDDKGIGKNTGDDKNLTDCKNNITAAITEFFLKIVLKDESVGARTFNKNQQKAFVEAYMNDYKTDIDKSYYDNADFKDKITALGLTIPA